MKVLRFELELKSFRLHQPGIFQDRIARRVGLGQQRISRYLRLLPQIAKGVNTDLSKGFSVPQVAQKHGWSDSVVWSQALVKANDFDRFKALHDAPWQQTALQRSFFLLTRFKKACKQVKRQDKDIKSEISMIKRMTPQFVFNFGRFFFFRSVHPV